MRKFLHGLIVLLSCLINSGCSGAELSLRHESSGLNQHFSENAAPQNMALQNTPSEKSSKLDISSVNASLGRASASEKTLPEKMIAEKPANTGKTSFKRYIQHSRDMIARARVDLAPASETPTKIKSALTETQRLNIISGNAPFELFPSHTCQAGKTHTYKRGILLIHGLSNSPYIMRPLGEFFSSQCFHVMAILLPGHGTRPGDTLDNHWEDWDNAVKYGINKMGETVDEIYLGGYSLGGTLAIHESLQDKRIRGLFLFAPAVQITKLAALTNLLDKLGDLFPRIKWVSLAHDIDPFRYESVTMHSAYQIYLLTQIIQQELQQKSLNIPVFIASSDEDATIDSSATHQFFIKNISHANKYLLIYSAEPNLLKSKLNLNSIAQGAKNIEIKNSAFPKQHILSLSHTGLLMPPENSHYGKYGDYKSCIHYTSNPEKYQKCQKNPDQIGEIISKNMRSKLVTQRLMYNPQFHSLENSMKQFIERF